MCLKECDEVEACTIRYLIREYLRHYANGVRRFIRRFYGRLRYIYIMNFGTVRSKLLLELDAKLRAYSIGLAGSILSLLINENTKPADKILPLVIDEIVRSACGICVIQHGDNLDLVVDCVKHKISTAIEYATSMITPIAMGLAMIKPLELIEQISERGDTSR